MLKSNNKINQNKNNNKLNNIRIIDNVKDLNIKIKIDLLKLI